MAIKNYTTDVPVNKTVSEIHLMLADHGAKRILFDYGADNKIKAISFTIETLNGEQAVKLPANADRVREVLRQQKNNPKSRSRAQIDDSQEQAERRKRLPLVKGRDGLLRIIIPAKPESERRDIK